MNEGVNLPSLTFSNISSVEGSNGSDDSSTEAEVRNSPKSISSSLAGGHSVSSISDVKPVQSVQLQESVVAQNKPMVEGRQNSFSHGQVSSVTHVTASLHPSSRYPSLRSEGQPCTTLHSHYWAGLSPKGTTTQNYTFQAGHSGANILQAEHGQYFQDNRYPLQRLKAMSQLQQKRNFESSPYQRPSVSNQSHLINQRYTYDQSARLNSAQMQTGRFPVSWPQPSVNEQVNLVGAGGTEKQQMASRKGQGIQIPMPSINSSADVHSTADLENWKEYSYYQHLSILPFLLATVSSGQCKGIAYTNETKSEVIVDLQAFTILEKSLNKLLHIEADDETFNCVRWSQQPTHIVVNIEGMKSELPKMFKS
ncbi:hypothetical protein [Endozoicomonas elysicola]|uniref:Uncharacterized protein n=1 Tax=Endozoicomonas elysicola TaxID=305900 RepID=A0A081KDX7_9GAMM|nr:hypothetical protein [Endozoicomonas elysicola]KEI72353.1 hypothetical protein GV64_17900 [Endozoicomonas elysicola]